MCCQFLNNSEIVASLIGAAATIIAGLLIFLLSRGYYKHSKEIERDRMMKELFYEFNSRYDKLNEVVDKVSKMTIKEWDNLNPKKKKRYSYMINDYFNLCAEEYFWFQKYRIEDKIWNSWSYGMNIIFNRSKVIQMLWEEECTSKEGVKSYYIDKKDAFFKINKDGL